MQNQIKPGEALMDTNKMREQFEAAWHARYPEHGEIALKRSGLDPEDYCNTRVKDAWWAWQASREAVVVELPKVIGFEGAYDSHRHHEFVPSMSDVEDADEIFGLCRSVEVKEAIEAQGLKVKP